MIFFHFKWFILPRKILAPPTDWGLRHKVYRIKFVVFNVSFFAFNRAVKSSSCELTSACRVSRAMSLKGNHQFPWSSRFPISQHPEFKWVVLKRRRSSNIIADRGVTCMLSTLEITIENTQKRVFWNELNQVEAAEAVLSSFYLNVVTVHRLDENFIFVEDYTSLCAF